MNNIIPHLIMFTVTDDIKLKQKLVYLQQRTLIGLKSAKILIRNKYSVPTKFCNYIYIELI